VWLTKIESRRWCSEANRGTTLLVLGGLGNPARTRDQGSRRGKLRPTTARVRVWAPPPAAPAQAVKQPRDRGCREDRQPRSDPNGHRCDPDSPSRQIVHCVQSPVVLTRRISHALLKNMLTGATSFGPGARGGSPSKMCSTHPPEPRPSKLAPPVVLSPAAHRASVALRQLW
jgi:hypothetical protein